MPREWSRSVPVLILLFAAGLILFAPSRHPPQAASALTCVRYEDLLSGPGPGSLTAHTYNLAVSGAYAYAGGDSGIAVLDCTDPAAPRQVGTVRIPYRIRSVAAAGTWVCAIDAHENFLLIDASDPASPQLRSTTKMNPLPEAVAVSKQHAYVTTENSLEVVDISNPSSPSILASVPLRAMAQEIAAAGSFVYLATADSGLVVEDVSNPALPTLAGTASAPRWPGCMAVAGGVLCLGNRDSLFVFDVSDPASPRIRGGVPTRGSASSVTVAGGYAYLADEGLEIFDLSDPANPRLAESSDYFFYSASLATNGDYVYLASGFEGLGVFHAPLPAPEFVHGRSRMFVGAKSVAVSGTHAYATSAFSDSLEVMDVSDPAAPRTVGRLALPDLPYGLAVAGGYAYVAVRNVGLLVADVSDPAAPRVAATLATPSAAMAVTVSGHYAYIADYTAGLQVCDISDPTAPRIAGSVNTRGGAWDVKVSGSYAYVGDYSDFEIIDVSNPAAPVVSASLDMPGFAIGVAIAGPYVYVDGYYKGLEVIDCSHPQAPEVMGELLPTQTITAADVAGTHLYVVEGFEDLLIYDISAPASPVETAAWDQLEDPQDIAASGAAVYVADLAGLEVLPVECAETAPPIAAFALVQPVDADSVHTTRPVLRWHPARPSDPADSVRYAAYWSQDPAFAQADSLPAGRDTVITAGPNPLSVGTVYHWRVLARDPQGNTRWSDPSSGRSFVVADNNTPTQIAPQAAAEEDGILVSWRILEAVGVTATQVYRRVGTAAWVGVSPLLPLNGPAGQYLDRNVEPGVTYDYEIEVFGPGGPAGRFGPTSATMAAPRALALDVWPNPGRSTATLSLAMPRSGDLQVRVFDVRGAEVAHWSEAGLKAGLHQRPWLPVDDAGRPLASGRYFFRLDCGSEHASARWTHMR